MDPEYTDKLLSTVSTATTSGAQDPLVSLHAVYDAIIKGDFEAIGEFMTDDVELNICGFRAIDGIWRGRDDVVTAARKNYAQLDSQQPAIEGMISQGDSVGRIATGAMNSCGLVFAGGQGSASSSLASSRCLEHDGSRPTAKPKRASLSEWPFRSGRSMLPWISGRWSWRSRKPGSWCRNRR
jgi:ketosteroid isomerase-like protein